MGHKMKMDGSCLLKVAGLVLGLLASFTTLAPRSVKAQEPITTGKNFTVNCLSTGLLCNPSFSLEIATGGRLQMQYFAPLTHCGSVRLHIFVDDALKLTTGFLGWFDAPPPFDALPLDTGLLDFGPVALGTHLLQVQAEAQPSGCIVDNLVKWDGTLIVFTTPAVPPSIGGTVTGVNPRTVICWNMSTWQIIRVATTDTAWNCQSLGLRANPGDSIFTGTVGTAD
jgi:hypothetical protein